MTAWDADQPVGKPLPIRWYDDAIPYDFPDCEQNISATDGHQLTFTQRPRWGDYYNLLGSGAGGRLVWTHTQVGNQAATYSITFRLLPAGQKPTRLAPRGMVGDGSHRCGPRDTTSTSIIHSRIAADWDGDGRPDIIGSSADGKIWWWRNLDDGIFGEHQPIQMPEVCYSPFATVVDWNGDSDQDLLVGTAYGYTCWFERSFLEHGHAVADQSWQKSDDSACPTLMVGAGSDVSGQSR